MVSIQANSFWKNALGKSITGKVTATLFRKKAVTVIHKHMPSLKSDAATMMNHNVRTAEESYFLQNKQSKVTGTSRMLSEALRQNHDNVTDDEYSVLSEDFIRTHCQDALTGSLNIKVVCSLQKTNDLFSLVNTKTLYDRLRYVQRKMNNQSTSTETVTAATEMSEIVTASNGTSQCFESDLESDLNSETTFEETHRSSTVFEDNYRTLYTTSDVDLIHRYFGDLIKSSKFITKKVVTNISDENKDILSPMVKKFSFRSILMKIRTERKKIQKH